jgi:CBS domain-containing protein
MRCEEIMVQDVECVSPRDTVEDAAIKMRDEDIGFLPVCDQSKKVQGTLTDRDIVIRVIADRKPSDTLVEDAMTRECVSCRPEDDLSEAERSMAGSHVARIVVCDESDRLVGVISLSDIAQHDRTSAAVDTFREVTEREAKT